MNRCMMVSDPRCAVSGAGQVPLPNAAHVVMDGDDVHAVLGIHRSFMLSAEAWDTKLHGRTRQNLQNCIFTLTTAGTSQSPMRVACSMR